MNSTELALNHILKTRIAYKPGYKFEIRSNFSSFMLTISRKVQDVRDPAMEIDLHQSRMLVRLDSATFIGGLLQGNPMHFRDFVYEIHQHIKAFELHEMDEWFKIDGEHFNDPHPELKIMGESVR